VALEPVQYLHKHIPLLHNADALACRQRVRVLRRWAVRQACTVHIAGALWVSCTAQGELLHSRRRTNMPHKHMLSRDSTYKAHTGPKCMQAPTPCSPPTQVFRRLEHPQRVRPTSAIRSPRCCRRNRALSSGSACWLPSSQQAWCARLVLLLQLLLIFQAGTPCSFGAVAASAAAACCCLLSCCGQARCCCDLWCLPLLLVLLEVV